MKLDMERWGETLLGAAVALVAGGFFVFAAAQGGQTGGGGAGYTLTARFQQADGINVGSDVRVAGVKVGVVRDVKLEPETFMALVTLSIDKNVQVLNDSTAKVATDGLLGGSHVSIEQAGFEPLLAGAEIINTQGSVDILTVLASAAQSAASGGSQSSEEFSE